MNEKKRRNEAKRVERERKRDEGGGNSLAENPMVTGRQKWGSRGEKHRQIHRKCSRVLLLGRT